MHLVLALCLFAALGANTAIAQDLTIAESSDLDFGLREIVAEYERATGNNVRIVSASSGTLYAQIHDARRSIFTYQPISATQRN